VGPGWVKVRNGKVKRKKGEVIEAVCNWSQGNRDKAPHGKILQINTRAIGEEGGSENKG